jgi:PAS domain S-box-containing protein
MRTAATGLAATSVRVAGSVRTVADLSDEQLEAAACVLTDDRDVLAAAGMPPVVYAVDPAGDDSIDRLLADGAADVVPGTAVEEPSLLAHRLRRTVERASSRRADRRARRYRTLLEHSSDLVVVVDDEARITDASPAFERVSGCDPADLRGTDFFEYVHPDDSATVAGAFDAVRDAEPGSTRTVEYECRHADGSWYRHEAVFTKPSADTLVDGVVASVRDVTAQHHIEQELRESLERVTDAFCALDARWRFTYVNDRALEQFGLERTDLLERGVLDVFPEMEGTPFQRTAAEAAETQEPRTVEAYYEPFDAWIEARIYPSQSGVSVYWRDVTERVERTRELTERTERLQALVEHAPVVLLVVDDDGTVTLSEGRGLENVGVDADEAVGESFFELLADYPEARADARAALEGESVHSRRHIGDRVLETWYRPIVDDGDVDRVIAVANDVTERAQYQEALNALHEATSHLSTVDSEAVACEYIADVATDVLDLDAVVYSFDDDANELVPAACSSAVESTFGSPSRLGPDDGTAWEAFVDGDPTVHDDLREPVVSDAGTEARSALFVPLGEHGLLVALSTVPGRYDGDTVELAQLFATAAEAALDRIGRTRRLHDRERELERQNRHLERVTDANEMRLEIEQLLLMADSRTEIERGVPERLAELEACSLAWIGEPDPNGDRLRPQSRAGPDRGYLDAVTVTTVDDTAAEPAGRAARSGEPVYVENVAESVHDGEWRRDALSRNFQSAYAVPLVYDGFLYGVLTIYGTERDAFHEPLRSTLAELGETIAYGIDAVRRKNALPGADRTEVELEVEPDATLCRLADRLDARVSYQGATTRDDGSLIAFVAVEGDEDALDVDTTAIDGIGSVSRIVDHGTETLLRLRLTEPFLGSIVETYGARLREFVADASTARATLDVPDAVEIREVVSDLDRSGPSVSLLARRETTADDPITLRGPARNALLEAFTDRQREVVQTAYHGGFFEWPRAATGEEIADSLDISPPAFHKHVRATERKLFGVLFGGTTAEVN